ncbi:MAG: D-serine ammonia-lyase [Lachnospiraceae bacterium]
MSEKTWRKDPVLKKLEAKEECLWINPDRLPFAEAKKDLLLSMQDMEEASLRLARFAPLIAVLFPETKEAGGIIESELAPIPRMRQRLLERGIVFPGQLYLKRDSDLPIAGSVKARGGIYEVLKHTEDLALQEGLLRREDAAGTGNPQAYLALSGEKARAFFARHSVQVGSTGNLGMSIGIMSAALGHRAIVHMSSDAKQWKKDLLRSRGVTVVEYESDYSEAVKKGREASKQDPMSYFVDDENSKDLFLGYAVAALRLRGQLEKAKISVDRDHPLFVYLPCGVGGAPGGITFGLKQVYGDAVHCFFVEPVQAPGMLAGMASGLQNGICVQDLGLTGKTEADGLAVGRPSGFVGGVMTTMLDGACTVQDGRLFSFLRDLYDTEKIFLEPSACAGFRGLSLFAGEPAMAQYLQDAMPALAMEHVTHLVWATGGHLVPEKVRQAYLMAGPQKETGR